MHGHRHDRGYRHPMRGLGGILWILGFFILARYGWWWPGILVLIGISMLMGSIFRETEPPQTFENPQPPKAPPSYSTPVSPPAPAPVTQAPAASAHRVDLLPATCSRCGAPMRAHEVKWTGAQSASCPYCGSTLAMGGINAKPAPRTWGQ